MSPLDDKERRISEAALRLFLRHGFRKVTMMDVAAEAGMSRPSLYAAFANKEAILAALLRQSIETHVAASRPVVEGDAGLREKLDALLEIWVLEPVESVLGSDNASDLLANCAVYAPGGTEALYAALEAQLVDALRPAMSPAAEMSAEDLGHVLRMAVVGLKASTTSVDRLRRLTAGLVTMAVAAAEGAG